MMNDKQVKDYLRTKISFDSSAKTIDFRKSHGSWLVDLDGKEYLDAAGSFASCSLGYNHPKIISELSAYPEVFCNKIANSDLYSEIMVGFIARIFSILPPEGKFDRIFFADGGTTANDFALKTCYDFFAKKRGIKEEQINDLDVVHFRSQFSGRVGLPISLTNTSPEKTALYPKHKFTRITPPHVSYPSDIRAVEDVEATSLSELESALKKENVVAVIMEPLLGEGGNLVLRKEYLKQVRELTQKYDTMLIFDEVQTFGMCEKFWLCERYGVMPDIITFGKKLQIAGFVVSTKIREVPDNVFEVPSRISSTFCGSTIDMLRASFIIDIIKEENLLNHAAECGEYIRKRLRNLSTEYPVVSNCRGEGLLIAWDLPNKKIRDDILQKLNEKLFILPCGHRSIRLRNFLNTSVKEFDLMMDIIEEIIRQY
jgi:L-lysine 6-transaminase